MRLFFKLLFLLIVLSPIALGGILYLAVETQPDVPSRNPELTPASMARASRIIEQNDPRKMKSGDQRTLTTSAADLDLAVNYLAHLYGRGSAQLQLDNGSARIAASLRLPLIPTDLFLNIDTTFTEAQSVLQLDAMRIGKVPVPVWLVDWAAPRLLAMLAPDFDYQAFCNAVKKVAVTRAHLAVTYEWQDHLAAKMRAILVPPEEQERLRAYHERLVESSRSLSAKNHSLIELLVPLFKLAAERSDRTLAAAENRAALLVLTAYINGSGLDKLMPEAKNWPRPTQHGVLLNRRDDSAKHFMISAALAANAGGPLADAVGLYKEVADSRGGSGFSFNDLAADRAGSKFGEYAAERANARALQEKLRAGISERDIMPTVADLPESMQEKEFKRRFGGVDAPEYKKMIGEIDRRVAALPLYR
jgi:hypothetical protein